MARPTPKPALSKAPRKEHPAAPDPAPPERPTAVSTGVMLSVRIDPELRRRAKVAAAEAGIPIQEWVSTAIQNALEQQG